MLKLPLRGSIVQGMFTPPLDPTLTHSIQKTLFVTEGHIYSIYMWCTAALRYKVSKADVDEFKK